MNLNDYEGKFAIITKSQATDYILEHGLEIMCETHLKEHCHRFKLGELVKIKEVINYSKYAGSISHNLVCRKFNWGSTWYVSPKELKVLSKDAQKLLELFET